MDKLELKHIAPYLPYGLKLDIGASLYPTVSMNGIWGNNIECNYHGTSISTPITNKSVKPILYPISSLTNTLWHEGKEFVPSDVIEKEIKSGVLIYEYMSGEIEFLIETQNYSQEIDLFDGYLISQKLIEWKFDINGLIGKGLAIDVTTLTENPYK